MKTSSFFLPVMVVVVGLSACDDPTLPPLGDFSVVVNGTATPQTTAQGWTVTVTRFAVNTSETTVAGFDGVVTATSEGHLFDVTHVENADSELVSGVQRIARRWEKVGFTIAPAADAPSVAVEGTMTKGSVTKTFHWAFQTAAALTDCATVEGPGIVVDGNGPPRQYVVTMSPLGLFADADAIAAADADNNGDVSLAELAGSLDEASRHVVSSFSGGTCNVAAADGAVPTATATPADMGDAGSDGG